MVFSKFFWKGFIVVHKRLVYLLEDIDLRREEMVFFIFNFPKGSPMKSLVFTIMLAACSILNTGWADLEKEPCHQTSMYVGISESDIGKVVPTVGIKTQCKDVILDINASYTLVKGWDDWHYATLSAGALYSFLRNDSEEFYGGLGVQVCGLFYKKNLKDNSRSLFPEFIVGVKRIISEDHFIFFQFNVHPWEIPLHSHSRGQKSGAVVFKMGISI